jgi:hypothetical protein
MFHFSSKICDVPRQSAIQPPETQLLVIAKLWALESCRGKHGKAYFEILSAGFCISDDSSKHAVISKQF